MGELKKWRDQKWVRIGTDGEIKGPCGTSKDKKNPEGDIEIQTIGLRPGEKLFEELLIDSNSMNTSHPLIYKALEKKIDSEFLENIINYVHSIKNVW